MVNKFLDRSTVTRTELQQECTKLTGHTLLEWATRTGKMRAGIKTIQPEEKVLVLSPTNFINSQWGANLSELGMTADVMCYASVHKVRDVYDKIILDECHHLTDRVYDVLSSFASKPIFVGLSGTMPRNALKMFRKLCGDFYHWKIPLDQVIRWGIIAKPKIICKGVKLRDDKKYLVFKHSNKKDKPIEYVEYGYHKGSIFNQKVNTYIQCTEVQYLSLIEEQLEYWKSVMEDTENLIPKTVVINKLNQIGNMRKALFANAKNKFIKRVITHFELEDKRVLIFCNDIPQAEFIDEQYAIHSKKTDNLLEKFNNHEVDKLLSINLLNEGVNVYDVDAVVILQVAKSEVRTAQQAARGLLGLSPIIILLFYRGTDDEKTVKKFLEPFSEYTQWL